MLSSFDKELEMYEKVVPKMNLLLTKLNIEDQLFPNAIYTSKSTWAIVLEDLSARNYVASKKMYLMRSTRKQFY